jgi:hypothetical protein
MSELESRPKAARKRAENSMSELQSRGGGWTEKRAENTA